MKRGKKRRGGEIDWQRQQHVVVGTKGSKAIAENIESVFTHKVVECLEEVKFESEEFR